MCCFCFSSKDSTERSSIKGLGTQSEWVNQRLGFSVLPAKWICFFVEERGAAIVFILGSCFSRFFFYERCEVMHFVSARISEFIMVYHSVLP